VPKALLTDSDRFPFSDEDRSVLEQAGVSLLEVAGHDRDEIAQVAGDASAVFVYYARFDEELISRLRSCRVLARCGVGYDNIDVEAAWRHGIVVTYVPSYGSVDVAEHTMALLLACARRLGQCDRAVQAGTWPSYSQLSVMRRLAGQTLGLLGFGHIGRQVALRARAFDLAIIAHDPYVEITAGEEPAVELVGFEALFSRSDFISVHLPLTPETRHIVNEPALSLLRPSAYLINTSRGAIVDQAALVRLLDSGRIAGAGLDVLEHEPPQLADDLLGRPNVLISPHSAAYTEEALAEVRRGALLDVLRVLQGQPPQHPVPELLREQGGHG
jgi:D-3-phosphoglycerate dehydrogenase